MEVKHNNSPIVLIIHGFASHPEKYAELKKIVEECYPNADTIIPDFSLPIFSTTHPNKIVTGLLQDVDKAWEDALEKRKANDHSLPEIIIIGHSAGCLLARKLYIIARGENQNCPFEDTVIDKQPGAWAKQVVRLILVAGINNGWTTTQHLNNTRAIEIGVGIMLGHIIQFFTWKRPFAFQIRKGSSFV